MKSKKRKVIGDPYVKDDNMYDYVTPPDAELTVPGRVSGIIKYTCGAGASTSQPDLVMSLKP
jgi:hypothetical protein